MQIHGGGNEIDVPALAARKTGIGFREKYEYVRIVNTYTY